MAGKQQTSVTLKAFIKIEDAQQKALLLACDKSLKVSELVRGVLAIELT